MVIYLLCSGIDVVRGRIKMFAQQRVNLPTGRHKMIILDEADRCALFSRSVLNVSSSYIRLEHSPHALREELIATRTARAQHDGGGAAGAPAHDRTLREDHTLLLRVQRLGTDHRSVLSLLTPCNAQYFYICISLCSRSVLAIYILPYLIFR